MPGDPGQPDLAESRPCQVCSIGGNTMTAHKQLYRHKRRLLAQASAACSMAWQCFECARFWGFAHKRCPLCELRAALRMCLRRKIADVSARMIILQFTGSRQTVLPLPTGQSMCTSLHGRGGTPFCCRCSRCKAPLGEREDRVLLKLARKAGHGRAYIHYFI